MRTLFFLTIGLFLFGSCATVFSPPGGPKDTTPPQNLEAEPPMLSKNVKAKKFEFKFDEFIKLNDPYNEILISPPLQSRPEYKIKGKTLQIKLNDTLQPNTTYTINFGKSIVDNNEGNALVGLNYVFSTGDHIDSLQIDGKVTDAFTKKPAEGVGVLLYKAEGFTDSTFQTQRPFYYALTSENGRFKLKYLKEGKYRVFVLKDENFNLIYDAANEKVGFLDAVLHIQSDSVYSINLTVFNDLQKPSVNTYFVENQTIANVVFNQTIKTYTIDRVAGFDSLLLSYWNKEKDTLSLYYKFISSDKPELVISNKEIDKDTLSFRTEIFTSDSISKLGPLRESDQSKNVALKPGQSFSVEFERPILLPDTGIYLYEDSFKRLKEIEFSVGVQNPKLLEVKTNLKPATQYDLIFTKNSVKDYYKKGNKPFKINYLTQEKEAFGNLILKLEGLSPSEQYIIELLRGSEMKDRVIVSNQTAFEKEWKLLEPGSIQFRMVLDKNRDGRWTPGDITKKLQPEPVYYYPEKIEIRENWDLEIEDSPTFNLH